MKFLVFSFYFFISNYVYSEEYDFKEMLEEVNKVGRHVYESTKNSNSLEKTSRLNGFLDEYKGNKLIADFLLQKLAKNYSFNGQYKKALKAFDENSSSSKPLVENIKVLKTQNAVKRILKESYDRQIIMINEAHHVPQHRVLTYDLLAPLWQQGFRYFAAEAFNEGAENSLNAGYVQLHTGTYTQEPIFSNLVLYAKSLGYQIVSYEGRSNGIQDREQRAAQRLKEEIFDQNPKAKVVIHVGYDHINEESWLASYLKKDLKLDPLTIDQTNVTEKVALKHEPKTYTYIADNMAFENPIVLVNESNEVWSVDKDKYDMSIIWPRTQYAFGRPTWASLGRDHLPVNTQWCQESFPCMVEVFRFGNDDEVPMDRVVITLPAEKSSVFLSKGNNIVVVTNISGKQLYRKSVKH